MIKDSIVTKLLNLSTGNTDRIMSLPLPLGNQQHATLFSVYAPTLQVDSSEKDTFYADLRWLLKSVSGSDQIIIFGDFNARVDRDSDTWKAIIGKHGVGSCNDNGRLLLELCAELQLTITNTIFKQKDSLKTTWMLPRSKHCHLMDYIILRQRDLKYVLHTR